MDALLDKITGYSKDLSVIKSMKKITGLKGYTGITGIQGDTGVLRLFYIWIKRKIKGYLLAKEIAKFERWQKEFKKGNSI